MGRVTKQAICIERVRRVPKQFSWIDQRLVRHGYTRRVSPTSLALYLFLIVVGDSEGLSFYGDSSIAEHLAFPLQSVVTAREELLAAKLIAYRAPLYQVLSLEDFKQRAESRPVPHTRFPQSTSISSRPHSIADVLAILIQEKK